MQRTNLSSGAIWESKVAYSRAVKMGNTIEVAGTVATDGQNVLHIGDSYLQTSFILEKIQQSLIALGGSLNDVVRTRIYVTDISKWEEVGRAHGEFFAGINPVTSMVEVAKLIDPNYLVEIEATAILDSDQITNIKAQLS